MVYRFYFTSPWTLFDNHSSYIYPNGNITDYDNWDLGIVNYDSYGKALRVHILLQILIHVQLVQMEMLVYMTLYYISYGQSDYWWLRSPGNNSTFYAFRVGSSGDVYGISNGNVGVSYGNKKTPSTSSTMYQESHLYEKRRDKKHCLF